MKKTKILQLLAQFDAYTMNRLEQYVYSDYFNRHEKVKSLFAILKEQAPEFDNEDILQPPNLYDKIGLEGRFNTRKWHHLVAQLYELILNFLAQEDWQEQPIRQKYHTLNALQHYHSKKQFEATSRQYSRLQKRAADAVQKYWHQYHYYDQQDKAFLASPKRRFDKNLQEKNDALDLFYIITKLQIACDMLSRNKVIKGTYETSLLSELKPIIEQTEKYQDIPLIKIYSTILQTLESNDEQYYQQLKQELEQFVAILHPEESIKICDYAQNYCIRKINSGETRYYQAFLDLYKFQLQHRLLFKNGVLAEWDYKNIVTTGIRLKDFEWTEYFIRKNKNKLPTDIQENAFTYNLAAYYYATGQHRNALQQLHQVDFTDLSYQLGAKFIQLKCYYELEEYTALWALIDAFKLLVRRNKDLSEYRQQAYMNLLKRAKQIARLKEQKFYLGTTEWMKKYDKLQQQMTDKIPLANADWIDSIMIQLKK